MVKTVNTTQEANHLSRECLERRLLRIYHGMYTGDVKSEINTIDNEINQMVYELYDLTEEEIAIVENS